MILTAQVNMATFRKELLLDKIMRERRKRRLLRRRILALMLIRKRLLTRVCLLLCLFLQSVEDESVSSRSCRLSRNSGWWDVVWATYSEGRFKKTFRVTKKTFDYILRRIRADIEKSHRAAGIT